MNRTLLYGTKVFIRTVLTAIFLGSITHPESSQANSCSRINTEQSNIKGEVLNDFHVSFDESKVWRDGYCSYSTYELPNFQKQGRRISEVKCLEHLWNAKYLTESDQRERLCGKRRRLVAGGKPVPIYQYAHMGAIGWISSENANFWVFKCGASLISERFMLTAAHCSRVSRRDRSVAKQEPSIVRLGDENILGANDDSSENLLYMISSYNEDMPIQRFIVHEKYRPPRKYNDIALIELKHRVYFSLRVRPACLWSSCDTSPFSSVSVTGWGIDDLATYTTTSMLQVAEIKMLETNKCNELLDSYRNRNWYGVEDHQFCAGHLAGGIDTCQGDSGGPLQYEMNITQTYPMHYIIGVTSFGYGCGRTNMPGVYTRISSFIGWIEQNVWGSETSRW